MWQVKTTMRSTVGPILLQYEDLSALVLCTRSEATKLRDYVHLKLILYTS